MPRLGIALLILGLAGCSDLRPDVIATAGTVQPVTGRTSAFADSIAVGDVTGGAWLFNDVDISNNTFRKALTALLKNKALLAPEGNGRWVLDCTLDIDAPLTLLSDQNIDAKIHYVLREKGSGKIVFDRRIETSSTRPIESPAKEVAIALLIGNERLRSGRQQAENAATGQNLADFLTALLAERPTPAQAFYSPSP